MHKKWKKYNKCTDQSHKSWGYHTQFAQDAFWSMPRKCCQKKNNKKHTYRQNEKRIEGKGYINYQIKRWLNSVEQVQLIR